MTQDPQKIFRALKVVIVLALIPIGALIAGALDRGSFADACAEGLVDRVARADRAYVEGSVESPMLAEQILAASQVELGFVRPVSSEWTRVGLFVKPTASSTRAQAVVLLLDHKKRERCVFLRDYEGTALLR